MRLALMAMVAMGLAPIAVQANVLYDCDFPQSQPGSWVSPKLAVALRSDGTASVVDVVLIHFEQSPAPANVTRNDDRRLNLHWSVRNPEDRTGVRAASMQYNFRLNKQTMKASVLVTMHQFSNTFSGRGSCTIRKPE